MTLLCGMGFAETVKKDYKVSSFTRIDVSGIFKVTLSKGNTCAVKVEVEQELIPYLDIKVNNNVLELDFVDGGIPKGLQRKYKDLTVRAQVTMPMINGLEMSGVTSLRTTDNFLSSSFELDMSGVSNAEFATLTCTEVSIDLSGVSNVFADLETEDFSADISGSSKATFDFMGKEVTFADVEVSGSCALTLIGKAIRCDLEVSGAGKFNGENFEVGTMRADISGAGKADVRVKSSLQPEVSGAAKLRYTGGCVIKNLDVSGAANISSY